MAGDRGQLIHLENNLAKCLCPEQKHGDYGCI